MDSNYMVSENLSTELHRQRWSCWLYQHDQYSTRCAGYATRFLPNKLRKMQTSHIMHLPVGKPALMRFSTVYALNAYAS